MKETTKTGRIERSEFVQTLQDGYSLYELDMILTLRNFKAVIFRKLIFSGNSIVKPTSVRPKLSQKQIMCKSYCKSNLTNYNKL